MNQPEPWNISEIADIVALLNRASQEDRFDPEVIRNAIASDPDFDPNYLLCVREEGRIVGAIAAEIRQSRDVPPRPPIGHVKLLAVGTEHQRRGIGGALLGAVERQFVDAGVATCRIFANRQLTSVPASISA